MFEELMRLYFQFEIKPNNRILITKYFEAKLTKHLTLTILNLHKLNMRL